jgi:hypothetical protein
MILWPRGRLTLTAPTGSRTNCSTAPRAHRHTKGDSTHIKRQPPATLPRPSSHQVPCEPPSPSAAACGRPGTRAQRRCRTPATHCVYHTCARRTRVQLGVLAEWGVQVDQRRCFAKAHPSMPQYKTICRQREMCLIDCRSAITCPVRDIGLWSAPTCAHTRSAQTGPVAATVTGARTQA